MSDAANPYQSPEATAVPLKPLAAHGSLTETMLIYLKGASPWLRFIGVLGFISAGLIALWGIFFFALIPLMGQTLNEIPGFEAFSEFSGTLGIFFGGGMGLLVIGCAVLVFFPSLFAYRFGEKIRSYLRSGTDKDLELAFRNNKSFWKFYGIVCIVYLAFIPVMIVIAIIAALASAFI